MVSQSVLSLLKYEIHNLKIFLREQQFLRVYQSVNLWFIRTFDEKKYRSKNRCRGNRTANYNLLIVTLLLLVLLYSSVVIRSFFLFFLWNCIYTIIEKKISQDKIFAIVLPKPRTFIRRKSFFRESFFPREFLFE